MYNGANEIMKTSFNDITYIQGGRETRKPTLFYIFYGFFMVNSKPIEQENKY
jgi:hypothetical protein